MPMDTSSQTPWFDEAETQEFGEVHLCFNPPLGLRAIVAIHNTERGPALGGCRFFEYASEHEAIRDAMRLAQGMTYKAALAQLPFGGGKAVLMRPRELSDRRAYFKAFGQFVEHLGGRYLTAIDIGTAQEDMDLIATQTQHVFNPTRKDRPTEDPSPHTARGVFHGIRASVRHQLGRSDLKGLHVAIQGLGHVGFELARLLHQAGARLSVSDVRPEIVERCVREMGATAVSVDHIHRTPCDVFAPCALGGILNEVTIPELQTNIVAGGANNQLDRPDHGLMLHQRGILYAPDYAINPGGLIYVSLIYLRETEKIGPRVEAIADTLDEIFDLARTERQPPSAIAYRLARERIQKPEH